MRLSCNGCRILRKGCTDNCTIRPCLQWIHSPESQANATLFLAKFYGRAGLLNLLDAAPPHLHPAVFKSLLYESCGRIVNPVYGSVGLFLTGEWDRCQAAVDAVMMGSDISGGSAGGVAVSDSHGVDQGFVAACDIRHVAREGQANKMKGRGRFKRNGKVIKPKARVGWVDSSALWKPVQEMSESDSVFSGETVEASLANRDGDQDADRAGKAPLNLNLSLGEY
ncbi:LOB domain-containing protein 40-like [Neltuma alba]|uniref:LOB domain-containing protein 40-like n=1 Tax=Neltuma alba TaxID=207710 RepID=UPI0010A3E9E2|nr:LOB domain-containing protein 40-like [Prosopis alba]